MNIYEEDKSKMNPAFQPNVDAIKMPGFSGETAYGAFDFFNPYATKIDQQIQNDIYKRAVTGLEDAGLVKTGLEIVRQAGTGIGQTVAHGIASTFGLEGLYAAAIYARSTDDIRQEYLTDGSRAGNLAFSVGKSLVQVAAMNAVGGLAAAVAPAGAVPVLKLGAMGVMFGAESGQRVYDEAIAAGESPEAALKAATAVGGSEALLTLGMGAITKRGLEALPVFRAQNLSRAIMQGTGLYATLKNAGREVLPDVLAEGVEEGLTSLSNLGLQDLMLDRDIAPKQYFDAVLDAVMGAGMGVGAMTAGVAAYNRMKYGKINYNNFMDGVQYAKEGTITPEFLSALKPGERRRIEDHLRATSQEGLQNFNDALFTMNKAEELRESIFFNDPSTFYEFGSSTFAQGPSFEDRKAVIQRVKQRESILEAAQLPRDLEESYGLYYGNLLSEEPDYDMEEALSTIGEMQQPVGETLLSLASKVATEGADSAEVYNMVQRMKRAKKTPIMAASEGALDMVDILAQSVNGLKSLVGNIIGVTKPIDSASTITDVADTMLNEVLVPVGNGKEFQLYKGKQIPTVMANWIRRLNSLDSTSVFAVDENEQSMVDQLVDNFTSGASNAKNVNQRMRNLASTLEKMQQNTTLIKHVIDPDFEGSQDLFDEMRKFHAQLQAEGKKLMEDTLVPSESDSNVFQTVFDPETGVPMSENIGRPVTLGLAKEIEVRRNNLLQMGNFLQRAGSLFGWNERSETLAKDVAGIDAINTIKRSTNDRLIKGLQQRIEKTIEGNFSNYGLQLGEDAALERNVLDQLRASLFDFMTERLEVRTAGGKVLYSARAPRFNMKEMQDQKVIRAGFLYAFSKLDYSGTSLEQKLKDSVRPSIFNVTDSTGSAPDINLGNFATLFANDMRTWTGVRDNSLHADRAAKLMFNKMQAAKAAYEELLVMPMEGGKYPVSPSAIENPTAIAAAQQKLDTITYNKAMIMGERYFPAQLLKFARNEFIQRRLTTINMAADEMMGHVAYAFARGRITKTEFDVLTGQAMRMMFKDSNGNYIMEGLRGESLAANLAMRMAASSPQAQPLISEHVSNIEEIMNNPESELRTKAILEEKIRFASSVTNAMTNDQGLHPRELSTLVAHVERIRDNENVPEQVRQAAEEQAPSWGKSFGQPKKIRNLLAQGTEAPLTDNELSRAFATIHTDPRLMGGKTKVEQSKQYTNYHVRQIYEYVSNEMQVALARLTAVGKTDDEIYADGVRTRQTLQQGIEATLVLRSEIEQRLAGTEEGKALVDELTADAVLYSLTLTGLDSKAAVIATAKQNDANDVKGSLIKQLRKQLRGRMKKGTGIGRGKSIAWKKERNAVEMSNELRGDSASETLDRIMEREGQSQAINRWLTSEEGRRETAPEQEAAPASKVHALTPEKLEQARLKNAQALPDEDFLPRAPVEPGESLEQMVYEQNKSYDNLLGRKVERQGTLAEADALQADKQRLVNVKRMLEDTEEGSTGTIGEPSFVPAGEVTTETGAKGTVLRSKPTQGEIAAARRRVMSGYYSTEEGAKVRDLKHSIDFVIEQRNDGTVDVTTESGVTYNLGLPELESLKYDLDPEILLAIADSAIAAGKGHEVARAFRLSIENSRIKGLVSDKENKRLYKKYGILVAQVKDFNNRGMSRILAKYSKQVNGTILGAIDKGGTVIFLPDNASPITALHEVLHHALEGRRLPKRMQKVITEHYGRLIDSERLVGDAITHIMEMRKVTKPIHKAYMWVRNTIADVALALGLKNYTLEDIFRQAYAGKMAKYDKKALNDIKLRTASDAMLDYIEKVPANERRAFESLMERAVRQADALNVGPYEIFIKLHEDMKPEAFAKVLPEVDAMLKDGQLREIADEVAKSVRESWKADQKYKDTLDMVKTAAGIINSQWKKGATRESIREHLLKTLPSNAKFKRYDGSLESLIDEAFARRDRANRTNLVKKIFGSEPLPLTKQDMQTIDQLYAENWQVKPEVVMAEIMSRGITRNLSNSELGKLREEAELGKRTTKDDVEHEFYTRSLKAIDELMRENAVKDSVGEMTTDDGAITALGRQGKNIQATFFRYLSLRRYFTSKKCDNLAQAFPAAGDMIALLARRMERIYRSTISDDFMQEMRKLGQPLRGNPLESHIAFYAEGNPQYLANEFKALKPQEQEVVAKLGQRYRQTMEEIQRMLKDEYGINVDQLTHKVGELGREREEIMKRVMAQGKNVSQKTYDELAHVNKKLILAQTLQGFMPLPSLLRGKDVPNTSALSTRATISVYDAMKFKGMKIEDFSSAVGFVEYVQRTSKAAGMLMIADAAMRDGVMVKKDKNSEQPVGWEDGEKLGQFFKDAWISGDVYNAMVENIVKGDIVPGWFRGTLNMTKMLTFYNPLIMGLYNVPQMARLGAVPFSPKTWQRAWEIANNPNDPMRLEISRSGAVSVPVDSGIGFRTTIDSLLDPSSPIQKFFKQSLGVEGFRKMADGNFLGGMKELMHSNAMTAAYQYGWDLTWQIDEVMRIAAYLKMKEQGYTPLQAGRRIAGEMADYGDMPKKTRQYSTLLMYTPIYTVKMIENFVTNFEDAGKVIKNYFDGKESPKDVKNSATALVRHLMMAGALQALMVATGFENDDDEWYSWLSPGLRYKKKIEEGPNAGKELMAKIGLPFMTPFREVDRGMRALFGGRSDQSRGMNIFTAYMPMLHPIVGKAIQVVTNTDMNGDPVVNEFDSAGLKAAKTAKHVLSTAIPMLGSAFGDTKFVTDDAREEFLGAWTAYTFGFIDVAAFPYIRSSKYDRVRNELRRTYSTFKTEVKNHIMESGSLPDAGYFERFNKRVNALYSELEGLS